MTRPERLQARFDTIEKTLEELYGKEMATCAAAAAWLLAIQYGAEQSMKELTNFPRDTHQPDMRDKIFALDAEHELMLRGFHKYLCSRLGIDVNEAIRHSKSFQQVVRDICYQGG